MILNVKIILIENRNLRRDDAKLILNGEPRSAPDEHRDHIQKNVTHDGSQPSNWHSAA